MKALITGGAGFIGSHLCDRLLAHGQQVTVIDNLSTGSLENVKHLSGHPHFQIITADILERSTIDLLVREADVVYHLAASVGVKHIMDNLVASIQNNILGTEVVLELASRYHKKVLITSTSEVYGRTTDLPSTENDDLRLGATIKSRWSYACSKALDEYLAFAYFHEHHLPVTVVRLFNTVGERQTDAYGMVIPTFIRQALAGKPLTIFGDGNQSRCFGHVKDVVWALQGLMEKPEATGEVYNIGNPEKITIAELADLVIALTGSTSTKVFVPYQQAYKIGFDDAFRREPDISKVKALLGFEPKYKLREILAGMIQHFEKSAAAPVRVK